MFPYIIYYFIAAFGGGGTIPDLLPPTNIVVTAGDAALRATFTKATNATNYRVQVADDSLFTNNVISVSVDTNKAVIGVANDIAHYIRIQSLRPGSTASNYVKAPGNYTPTYASRLATPILKSVIGVNNGIAFSCSWVPNQEAVKVEFSTSQYFNSIAYSGIFADSFGIAPAINDTNYWVRITAIADLKRVSYTAYFPKGIDGTYNSFIPHVVNSTMLHAPAISEVLVTGSTTLKVDAFARDIRDIDYTVQIATDTGFTSIVGTMTSSLDNLAITGLTSGIPYRLRIKSNTMGITSSGWYVYPSYVMTGTNPGISKILATGDSNTAGNPYGTPYPTQAAPYLNGSYFNTNITNQGLGSSCWYMQQGNENDTYNWAGYNNDIINIFTAAYGTNDATICGRDYAGVVSDALHILNKRNNQGFKCLVMTPGIPYGPGGWANSTINFPTYSEWIKNNGRTILGIFGSAALYDSEEFDISNCATGTESDCLYWGGQLHYTTAGYGKIASDFYAPMLNKFAGRIFPRPAGPTAFTWNAGTQNLEIQLPAGFVPADCQISLNWDGIGFNSTWSTLSSLTQHITTTQAIGTVACRIKSTRSTRPSAAFTNNIQYN